MPPSYRAAIKTKVFLLAPPPRLPGFSRQCTSHRFPSWRQDDHEQDLLQMTQLVQPYPSGSITSQPQHSLKPKCADLMFLVRNRPPSSEPCKRRFSRILKDRANCYRSPQSAPFAADRSPSPSPSRSGITGRAHKNFWPTERNRILCAYLLRLESTFKLHNVLQVIFHTRKYYIERVLELSEYPKELIERQGYAKTWSGLDTLSMVHNPQSGQPPPWRLWTLAGPWITYPSRARLNFAWLLKMTYINLMVIFLLFSRE
jgi:hypothetical protein